MAGLKKDNLCILNINELKSGKITLEFSLTKIPKWMKEFGFQMVCTTSQSGETNYILIRVNKKDNTILLARDFLGKKPLYYSIVNQQFVFSSSLNIVKSALDFCNINTQSIYSYLKIGYIPDPATMYKEIKSIAPGEAKERRKGQTRVRTTY
jgi:asparagine synthetase B (glutamine-hydrolysing)